MGVYNLELFGFFGFLIFLATVALLSVMTLASLITNRTGGYKSEKAKWSKFLFRAGLIFLLLDAICFVLFLMQGDKNITKEDGILFDWRMTYIWIPFHLIGYFLTAFGLRYLRLYRTEINEILDSWR